MVRYIANNDDEYQTLKEPPARAYLVLVVEGRLSQTFPLRGEVKLGREKDNGIVLADTKVSRHHASLAPVAETVIIHDLGSANGTYVNGVQISQPTRLHHHDRVSLGDTRFVFSTIQPDPATFEMPVSLPARSPGQAEAQSTFGSFFSNNYPFWLAIGCMALAIVALLVILALMAGLFLGRGGASALIMGGLMLPA